MSNIFRFLLRITREKLVTAIWKVKPILKWEIDSIQAVIDEEKENLQGKGHKITVKISLTKNLTLPWVPEVFLAEAKRSISVRRVREKSL